MARTKESRKRHTENQRAYVERMRACGYQRVCVWVPDTEAAGQHIKNEAALLRDEWNEKRSPAAESA